MKIAFATPFVQRSAIGRVSAEIARVLAGRGRRVEIVRLESVDDPDAALHPTDLPVRHWSSLNLDRLSQTYDLVVANVGDNYLFHGGLFPLLGKAPVLGVFHDFYLYNLFSGWLYDKGLGAEVHDGEIAATYGADNQAFARTIRGGQADLAAIAARTPMTEWAAARCAGALAHAEFYADRLREACPGPVDVAGLPWPGRSVPPLKARRRQGVVIVTLGVQNPNKCAAEVIQAIDASETLRARAKYHLVGPISPEDDIRLKDLAESLNFKGLKTFGAVDDATLEAAITNADIICSLRKPVLEGASASAIEGLLSARPTVVADAGFYGELPDDMVFKVPANVPIPALTAQLERLVGDETLRRETGVRAQAWAAGHFTVERYVDVLERLIDQTLAAAPVIEMGARIGGELSSYGLAADDPAVARIAATLAPVFQGAAAAKRTRRRA